MSDRVDFNEDGTLDEVCSAKGAHLEHLGGKRWFLTFQHADGTSSAFWFKSKGLKQPFYEKREPSSAALSPASRRSLK
jgi:hypothetical protein